MSTNKTELNAGMKVLAFLLVGGALIIGAIPLVALGVLYNGWAMSICWNLIVVKIFTGAPHLTWAMGIGLSTVVRVMRGNNMSNFIKEEYLMSTERRIWTLLLSPLFCVFMCWIIAHFIR